MKNETEITIAYIALEHAEEAFVGEQRRVTQSTGRLEGLKVRAVQTEDEYIPLVQEINLGRFELRGVTPALQSAADASVPRLEEPDRLEIDFHPVQILALVRTRENRLVLADLGEGQVDLPQDIRLLGVVPAPAGTFEVTSYDSLTKQNNKLGYHFNGTVPTIWVNLALRKREAAQAEKRRRQEEIEKERRDAAEHAEQERIAAQMREAAEAMPVEMFETKDREVAAQLRAAYRLQIVQSKRAKDANGQVIFSIEDPEGHGPGIAAAVATKRKELAAQHEDPDAWFERQRREADEVLSAR
jgi:hypothetical protein